MATRFAQMTPAQKERYLQKMRDPKLARNHVHPGARVIERPRIAVPVCKTCYNIPDRRPRVGPCECGKRWQREVMPKAVARIGSAAQMCAEARGCD